MKQTIALVDDDQNILTSVSMAMKAEGFDVVTYKDGEAAYQGMSKRMPDLAVLDIKMPRMDGLELLSALREKSNIPIIFLTSKDDEVDQLFGLRMGADDYITKPFSQRLLIERIRALLRRQFLAQNKAVQKESSLYHYGALEMDDERHECKWHGRAVNLTVTEYLLLQTLAMRPGHVKSREQLIAQAYGQNIHVDDRTIDSHIKRVRRKFKEIDQQFEKIETLYGVGYKYKED